MIRWLAGLVLWMTFAPDNTHGTPAEGPLHPVARDDANFQAVHAHSLRLTAADARDVLFLGDSLTQRWSEAPDLWQTYFGALSTANLGVGGDRVEHVLWRVERGALDRVRPRVLVLLIGTNNTGEHTAPELHTGIAHLLGRIRQRLPDTHVILVGLLPRGARLDSQGRFDPGTARQQVITELNATLPALADGRTVHWLSFGERYLAADGTIRTDLMPDRLHLSPEGYRVWAEALQPVLRRLLAEPPPAP